MYKGLYIITFLYLFLASCTGDKEVRALLDRAEAMMEAHPDSAYETLSSLPLKGEELKGSSERAFYLLLFANASYKLGKPMPSDTVFQEVVDYYDRHGNANERMLAYYLMGGIYLTRHEAPMALQWYLDATEQADTLSPDCNYWTLTKIYGQMAELYHSQLMPKEEIEANRKFSIYAEKAGNTYQAIRGIEKQLGAYQLMSDTAMILALTDSVHDLYLQAGMPQAAASVYPPAIHIYLARHDYRKAKQLMDIFEHESGLFDEEGNICKSREHYYESKGIYYEGIGKLDSAKYYYHLLTDNGYNLDAYRGLIKVFRKQHLADSVLSTVQLYEQAYQNYVNYKNIDAIRQVQSMYDYSRNQKIASQKEAEANDARHTLYYIIIAIFMVAVLAYVLFERYKKRQAIAKAQILDKAESLSNSLADTRREYQLFKTDKEQYEKTLQQRIHELEAHNNSMKERIIEYKEDDSELMNSDIVQFFLKKSEGRFGEGKVKRSELSALENAFRKHLKYSYRKYKQSNLTDFQLQVAILTRLNFTTKEIAQIFVTSQPSISNTKAKINNDLFGENTSESLYNNLLSVKALKLKE